MGLYSKMTSVNESTDAIVKEIEECTTFEPDAHIMEYVLDIHENDHKVFESLIECDFVSAVNESVMTESELSAFNEAADESKIKMIWNKIKEIAEGMIRKFKELAQSFIAKVLGLFKTDEKIFKKYSELLTKENLEGFKGIANFAFPKERVNKDNIESKLGKINQGVHQINNKIKFASDMETVNGLVDEAKKLFSEGTEQIKSADFRKLFFNDPVEQWIPKEEDIIFMRSALTAPNAVKDIKDAAAKSIGQIKTAKENALEKMHDAKKEGKTDITVAKCNAKYIVFSSQVKYLSITWSTFTSLLTSQIAASRKAMLICGNYAAKKAGKPVEKENTKGEKIERLKPEDAEVLNNSALIEWAVGESSDMFVAECLGY